MRKKKVVEQHSLNIRNFLSTLLAYPLTHSLIYPKMLTHQNNIDKTRQPT